MVIFTRKTIAKTKSKYPQDYNSIYEWYEKLKYSDWSNFSDMKQTFNSVDAIGSDRYVFNICGNKYRAVLVVHFAFRTCYVKFIGTHKEYDKIEAKTVDDYGN